jgi:hypothetical protein
MNPERRFPFGVAPIVLPAERTRPVPAPPLPAERTMPMPPMPLSAVRPAPDTQATAPLPNFVPPAEALPFSAAEPSESRAPLVPPPPPPRVARSGGVWSSGFWMFLLALDMIVLAYLFITWRLGR